MISRSYEIQFQHMFTWRIFITDSPSNLDMTSPGGSLSRNMARQ